MTHPETDTELLVATLQMYTEEFTGHVGEVVTPDEFAETEEQVEWAAQVFMFGYALGSVAGAHTAGSDTIDRETDLLRVTNIVDTVTDIAASDEVPISSRSVMEDFRE
jgi:hypothetical protein